MSIVSKVANFESATKAELIKLIQDMKMELLEAKNTAKQNNPSENDLTHIGVALYIDKDLQHSYVEIKYNPETLAAKVVKVENKGRLGHMARLALETTLGQSVIDQLRSLT